MWSSMWSLIENSVRFLADLALGILVILGFVCWVWFIIGLLYYRNHKDLPDYHVQADEHKGLTWWNGWRWSLSDSYRPLKEYAVVEAAIFGVTSLLALIWLLHVIFP
jgi:hypothetical protein